MNLSNYKGLDRHSSNNSDNSWLIVSKLLMILMLCVRLTNTKDHMGTKLDDRSLLRWTKLLFYLKGAKIKEHLIIILFSQLMIIFHSTYTHYNK